MSFNFYFLFYLRKFKKKSTLNKKLFIFYKKKLVEADFVFVTL